MISLYTCQIVKQPGNKPMK